MPSKANTYVSHLRRCYINIVMQYAESLIKYVPLVLMTSMFCSNTLSKDLPRMAILEFDVVKMDSGNVKILNERFMNAAVEHNVYQIISRSKMDEILNEQKFQLSGCVSDECIVQVGETLGAQYILVGTIGYFGETYTLDIRIINVETAEITRSAKLDIWTSPSFIDMC